MRVQKGYQKNFCRRFLSGMAFLFLFFLMGTGISHAEGRWEQEGQIGTIILRTIKKAIPAGYSRPRMDVGILLKQ